MHGMQHLPSFMQADATMEALLKYYEILGCEKKKERKSAIIQAIIILGMF